MPRGKAEAVTLEMPPEELCALAYPGHPKGCPNLGKKNGCPPWPLKGMDHIGLDLSKPIYAIWNAFDMAGHIARMRAKHPDWSDRQLACCLYWQNGARRELRAQIGLFRLEHGFNREIVVLGCPEAWGFNITATMKSVGITLDWPPRNIAYQVVLAGTRLQPIRQEKEKP